jgi:hypothetical protein
VEALYQKNMTADQLLPIYSFGLLDRTYAFYFISTGIPLRLNPGDQQTVELDYLDTPPGEITFTLTAVTDDGSYFEQTTSGQFGTTLVDTNGQSIDHSQEPQVLLEDSPVASALFKYGTSDSCLFDISLENTMDIPILLDVQQALPPATVVIDPGGGTTGTNQIVWELNLQPGQSTLIQGGLILPAPNAVLSNTVAWAYDEINANWIEFEAVPVVVTFAQSPPAQLQATGLVAKGFSLNLQTFTPGVYRVDATRDFTMWRTVGFYTNLPNVISIMDSATNTFQFYRAVQVQ